ncbi:MAG: DUF3299 domain-containing protein [Gammaproteobacteria bacterium]|nr:DUF3299 domain-containing protein [Gammaproteobacteria bacterium]
MADWELQELKRVARRFVALLIVAWPIWAAGGEAEEGEARDEQGEPRELTWDDLLPEGETVPPPAVDHSSLALFDDFPVTTVDGVVPELNGENVKLPGFVVPLDVVGDKVASFLLVPYFGACIHVPPPPPNQIVYVEFEEPVALESMYDPVWVTGKLGLEGHASSLARAGYSMKGQTLEKYRY